MAGLSVVFEPPSCGRISSAFAMMNCMYVSSIISTVPSHILRGRLQWQVLAVGAKRSNQPLGTGYPKDAAASSIMFVTPLN